MQKKKKLLCIVGPTATGKTDVAIEIAKKLGGELIACDSRQVYKGLDIGTGKLPGGDVSFQKNDRVWIIDDVHVWLYDVVDPQVQYDVWQYVKDGKEIIEQITREEKLPIIVGGTGLYLKGLLHGFDQMEVPVDLNLREELDSLSLEELHQRLRKINPEYFESLNNSELHNKRRLIRKIEINVLHEQLHEKQFSEGIGNSYDVLKIGLETDRQTLYKRIDDRVVRRVEQGMIEEAERIHSEGISFERMRQLGLEYGMLADLLEGKISSKKDFIEKLQFKIHQYAKRQLTWFKADPEIKWFDIELSPVEDYVLAWYNA